MSESHENQDPDDWKEAIFGLGLVAVAAFLAWFIWGISISLWVLGVALVVWALACVYQLARGHRGWCAIKRAAARGFGSWAQYM
jgi:Flp pilus assembly protein TadB